MYVVAVSPKVVVGSVWWIVERVVVGVPGDVWEGDDELFDEVPGDVDGGLE